jgi:hypothetical protein
MRCGGIVGGLALAASLTSLPMNAKAEELSLELAGAVAAFQEMIVFARVWATGEERMDLCIGLEVSPEPVEHPGLVDLPEIAFNRLQTTAGARADLHPASQCVIFGPAAAFKGRGAILLTYWDVDTEIDRSLRYRGVDVPAKPARLSFEPNRLAPDPLRSQPSFDILPNGRMRWDGYGQVADSCGPRYYDFSGDVHDVRILHVLQHPQVCD